MFKNQRLCQVCFLESFLGLRSIDNRIFLWKKHVNGVSRNNEKAVKNKNSKLFQSPSSNSEDISLS